MQKYGNEHRAAYRQCNEPVFKGSYVEFFIAVDDRGNYYNFEFNTLGTRLGSYGKIDTSVQNLLNT